MSDLIWIWSVWHSDGIPEFFPEKVDFEKKQMTKKHENFPGGKEFDWLMRCSVVWFDSLRLINNLSVI